MCGDMSEFTLQKECTLMQYTQDVKSHCVEFSCGDSDLDEFFKEDVFLYEEEMLGKTYLIGRLGVNIDFQGRHVGRQLMEYIKDENIASDNENACRFLVVDAINKPDTLAYYEHNGFVYMHKTEDIERLSLKRYDEVGTLIFEIPDNERLHTRMMYFDLKKLS